jgi:hypothetical protein
MSHVEIEVAVIVIVEELNWLPGTPAAVVMSVKDPSPRFR